MLNGTETGWTYQSNNKRFYKYFNDINLKNVGEVNTADVITNYFKASNTLNIPGTVVHWSNALFFYSGDMFSSLSEVTTWLSTHQTEVIYELAEPRTGRTTSSQRTFPASSITQPQERSQASSFTI